ncbi:LLM class F420-dependent oxidoreductase [Amnibacterium sp. CER49]|uniref:LLM class F420-dependent oxidoreductase n=1 Tax=Amnibacterium sp. CER49 TaxID=3039161 RepID=UPI00244A38A6|nr:LLM class F420-dependent oxidoreductase [Amnibacterium sp. CER49]MDH2444924.1 LLM class F420-dependent oxidoreductase [Amnibacterium sp. CER49]
MKLALHFPNFSMPGAPGSLARTLADTARAAEDAGFSTMTVMDHWFQMVPLGGSAEPMLEGYTTLGYLAAVTERLELGTLVTGVTYRYPGLLAKIVATLDVLSEGRAMLGVGAAWYEQEHAAYGVPFPPLKERFERLRETLEICEQMWSDDDGPYRGQYYELAETICNPRPLQRPRPPILIGGGGERKTLRLVAEHGDACNLFDLGPEEVGHKLDVLRQHCDDVGRDYGTIRKTLTTPGDDAESDEFLSRMGQYAALGIDQVWVRALAPDPAAAARRVGERLVPRLAEL